jgi:hypothetical protein
MDKTDLSSKEESTDIPAEAIKIDKLARELLVDYKQDKSITFSAQSLAEELVSIWGDKAKRVAIANELQQLGGKMTLPCKTGDSPLPESTREPLPYFEICDKEYRHMKFKDYQGESPAKPFAWNSIDVKQKGNNLYLTLSEYHPDGYVGEDGQSHGEACIRIQKYEQKPYWRFPVSYFSPARRW